MPNQGEASSGDWLRTPTNQYPLINNSFQCSKVPGEKMFFKDKKTDKQSSIRSFGGAYNQNEKKLNKRRLMLNQSYQMSCQQTGEIGIHNILESAVRIKRLHSIVMFLRRH